MRSIKAFGLAFAAVFALGAVAASGASATELTLTKGSYPAAFTSSSTATDTLFGSTEVKCTSGVKGTGELLSATDAHVTLKFEKCSALGGLATCTTSGEPAGTIRSELLALFNQKSGKGWLLFEKQEGKTNLATFECAGQVQNVTGTVNGNTNQTVKSGTPSKSMELNVLATSATKQEFLEGESPTTAMSLLDNGGAAAENAPSNTVTLSGTDEAEFK